MPTDFKWKPFAKDPKVQKSAPDVPVDELNSAVAVWQTSQDPVDYEPIMKALAPTVSSALTSFGGGNQKFKVRAHVLAQEAVRSFDPSKGAALPTHVYNNLQTLQREADKRLYAIHVPERTLLDAGRVRRFSAEWMDAHDTEPSIQAIAEGLSINPNRVQAALFGRRETKESKAMSDHGDLAATSARSPEDLWADVVYFDLDETNKKVFEWVTGYRGAPMIPKTEIARKLKITPAAVSSRLNTIKSKLDALHEASRNG